MAHGADGEVLDGETGWTSIPPSASGSQHLSRDSSSNRALAAGGREGGGVGGRGCGSTTSTSTNCSSQSRSRTAVKISGTGSSVRSGSRSNFFFGADFPLSASSGRAESVAASKLPSVPVDRKSAAVLSVTGSAEGAFPKAETVYGVAKPEEKVEGRVKVVDRREAKVRKSRLGSRDFTSQSSALYCYSINNLYGVYCILEEHHFVYHIVPITTVCCHIFSPSLLL